MNCLEALGWAILAQSVSAGAKMWYLTRQQRRVLAAVTLILLCGWAVKAWRQAHPPARPTVTAPQ